MNLIEGIITAITPIHIGSGKSKGTFIKTLDYLPGRTIRGMLGFYLYKNDKQLFENSGINEDKDISKMGIFFKNAYPFVYLFSWNEIPGKDNIRLIDFLIQKLGIDWVKTAKIEKIDNGMTIKLTDRNNFLSLKLNNEQTDVKLEINDVITDKFIVKIENSKINIYPVVNDGTTVASPLVLRWCKKCDTLLEKGENECKNLEDNILCFQEGAKYSGLMSFDSIKERKLKRAKPPSMQIETKCPITRTGHASMPEGSDLSPYHIESISKGAMFKFRILVKDEFTESIIESLKNAGIYYGLGGFRSRGYGSIIFDHIEKSNLETKIKKRETEISMMKSKLLVVNSQLILRKGDETIIGFDTFKEYASRTLRLLGSNGNIDVEQNEAKISSSIAAGWSLKHRNSLSELIPCIGPGSCVRVSGDSMAIAALEFYGVGEMINCGYGDVYIIGDMA